MSPISRTDGPQPGVRIQDRGILLLGLLLFVATSFFSQLDAIGNRLTDSLPVSLFEMFLVGLAGLATLLALVPNRTGTIVGYGPGIRLILALVCWIFVSFTFAEYQRDAMEYAIRHVAVLALPVLMTFFVRSSEDILAVIMAMIIAGGIAAVIVIIETRTSARIFSTAPAAIEADFQGKIRSAGGSDLNPTSAAQMLMVSVLLAGGLLASGYRRFRLVFVAVIALGTVAIVLTSARSALIGLGIGGIIILFRFYRSSRFPLILAGGLVIAIAGLFLIPESVLARFAAVTDFAADRSLFRRITYLRIGFDLLQASPIWGVGPGNFPLHYVDETYRYLPGRELAPRELHNTFLDVAVEYGIVGWIIFMTIIGVAMSCLVRTISAMRDTITGQVAFAVLAALSGLLVASFFMPHKDFRYTWLLIGMALQCGALLALNQARTAQP